MVHFKGKFFLKGKGKFFFPANLRKVKVFAKEKTVNKNCCTQTGPIQQKLLFALDDSIPLKSSTPQRPI
jgi:hypothetical protein